MQAHYLVETQHKCLLTVCCIAAAPLSSSQDAFIPQDRESGRSRGFAFVTMKDSTAAQTAIQQLNETDFNVSCCCCCHARIVAGLHVRSFLNMWDVMLP
jgi:hypothetical protein